MRFMVGLVEQEQWRYRYEKGIGYWKNQIPGLALLYQLHLDGNRLPAEFNISIEDLELTLGLGYLACHSPHDWGGSHLPAEINFTLMGRAWARLEGSDDPSARSLQIVGREMEMTMPTVPLEQRLENVDLAIAVVGQRGSGKGTVLQIMEERGISTAASSKGLREVARVIFQREAITPELVELGQHFKEHLGFDIFIRMILHQITSSPSNWWKQIAIDGLRTVKEIEDFRLLFGDRSRVLAVVRPGIVSDEAGWEVIQRRQLASGRVEYISFAQYVETQRFERDKIAAIVESADDMIQNDGNLSDLREKTVEYLDSL